MNYEKVLLLAFFLAFGAGVEVYAEGEDQQSDLYSGPDADNEPIEPIKIESGGFAEIGLGVQAGKVSPKKPSCYSKDQFESNLVSLNQQNPSGFPDGTYYYRSLDTISKVPSGFYGVAFGGAFGYDSRIKETPLMIGTAFRFGLGGGSSKVAYNRYTATLANETVAFNDCPFVDRLKFVCKGNLAACLRFGVALGVVHLFSEIGGEIDRYTIHYPTVKSRGKWASGLLVGLGGDVAITNNTFVGIVSHVVTCGQKRFKIRSSLDQCASINIRPILFRTMATVKYKFPSCPHE